MAKEWILNNAMNRFQLNFKRNVGPTSKSIRECQPKNKEEWKKYYFEKVRSEKHIENLGNILHEKIKSVVKDELDTVTPKDCIEYLKQLVIDRTFDGYMTEIAMIKDLVGQEIGVKVEESSDEWDRLFAVDFFIKIKDKYIGLQIKPQDIGT
ncbi:MjaI family restriction endonuclease, partial [archaeon]|nr:MjaI family restriction endonuclease [archaeon]